MRLRPWPQVASSDLKQHSHKGGQPLNPHFLGIKQEMHNPIWLPFHQLSALKEQMMTQPGILGQKSNYCTILFVLRHLKSRKKIFPMCRFEERTSPRGRKHRAGVLLPSASPRERATPALCFLPLEFGPFLEPTHREDIFPTSKQIRF